MPTYEYECEACGNKFEKFQSIMAAPIKVCPKCGKRKVKKLISAGAGLIFKGSGFYITDYREGSYNKDAKADSGAAAESKSTDAKPAEAKSGDGKAADAKPADTKPAESKDSKPAAEPVKPTVKAEPATKPSAARKDSAKSSKKR